MVLLEGTKERVLELLRARPRTAKEVAEALGVSRTAAQKHLQDLEERGLAASVVRVLLERNRALLAPLGLEGLPVRARLERLAAFLRERGYEAEVVEEEGALYLCQRRCPKLALSKEHEALCESELLAYEEALGLPLAREERIAEGGRCCRYRVKPVS